MLRLVRVQELVGADTHLSDEQLEQLRDGLYDLARVVITCYHKEEPPPGSSEPPAFAETLVHIPIEEREAVEERAAILEYDAGMNREMAEHLALSFHGQRARGARS